MLEPLNSERDGAAKGTDLAPRLVGQRVDWLTLTFRVVLLPEVMLQIGKRCDVADKTGGRAGLTLAAGGVSWSGEVRRDKQGKIYLEAQNRERILIHEAAPGAEHIGGGLGETPGWNVTIEQSGVALAACSRSAAIREAWRICALLGTPLESRRRRADVCVDVVGFDLRGERDGAALVKRSKKAPGFYMGGKGETRARQRALDFSAEIDETDARYRLHGFGDYTQTMTVGAGGAVQLRTYCKTTELAPAPKDWKKTGEEWGWKRNGWTGERVTRVEFQIRGEALEQFGEPGEHEEAPEGMRAGAHMFKVDPVLYRAALLRKKKEAEHDDSEISRLDRLDAQSAWRMRAADTCADADAEKLAGELDGLWQYLTRKWVRIVVPKTATRLARCRVDPRWKAIQEVAWTHDGIRPFRRFRRTMGASAKQNLGTNLSTLRARGLLRPAYDPRTGDVIEDAEAFVKRLSRDEQMRMLLSLTQGVGYLAGHATAEAILSEMGAEKGLVYGLEKYLRACAKGDRTLTEAIVTPPPDVDDYRPVRAWLPQKCGPHYGRGATIDLFPVERDRRGWRGETIEVHAERVASA